MSLTEIAPLLVTIGLLGAGSVSPTAPQTTLAPTEPKASPAVQKLLDEAIAHVSEQRPAEAMAVVGQALDAAHSGKDVAGEAQAERVRAKALSALNRNDEALTAWQSAASAWARAGDGPGQIEALASTSIELEAKQADQAAALRAQALMLAQSESKRPLAAAQMLQAAGQMSLDRKALGNAREFWLAALKLRERHAPNSLDLAANLHSLGEVAYRQKDLAAAREYFQKAVAIRLDKVPNSLDLASSLHSLGNVAQRQVDLVGARDYYRKALVIRERESPGSVDLANSEIDLGSIALQQGDLALGREYTRKGLAILEQKAPNSPGVPGSFNNLGFVTEQEGDFAAAREYHRKALAIQEQKTQDSMGMARSLFHLGNVALQQGDLAAARDYHQRALSIHEEKVPNSLNAAASLNRLGLVARRQGDLAAAREYHRKMLAIAEEKAPNSLYVAGSLNNSGDVASQEGDLVAAREYFLRALAIREEKAPNSLDVARSLNDLGKVASRQGNLAAAREHYAKALTIREEKAPRSLDMAESRYSLGELAEKQGDLPEAQKQFSLAWQLVQGQTGTLSGDEARQVFDSSTQFYAAKLIRSQMALGELSAAFTTLEESRAQALKQLLLEKQGLAKVVGGALWPEYQIAVAARNRAEQAAAKAGIAELLARRDVEAKRKERASPEVLAKAQGAQHAASKASEEVESAYTQARVKTEALWAEIQKTLPRLPGPPPLTLEQAIIALPAGTLFIAFSVGEEYTDVFLLRSGRHSGSPPLFAYKVGRSNKELRRLAEQFRLQVVSPSRLTAGTTAGRILFAELFPAAARNEIAGTERLLISPDGPLWEVPFAALVMNGSGAPRYLGAAKAITYTPSLSLFAQSRREPRRFTPGHQVSAVVLGHPIFNRGAVALARSKLEQGLASVTPEPTRSFGERDYLFVKGHAPEQLPETEGEAIAVARLYGSTPLLREHATEAALRQQIETADVIHLATHGYLHPVRAMSSGLLLTVPEKEPDSGETDNDGAFQAWEIYSQLKLNADLVVLSACETGRGQEMRAEGLVGMTRAFQYAGARSIVASQWKVADHSTASLMVAFHRSLRQGLPKDEALRKAMAHLRQNRATSHPYYWAPFILVGDSDNSILATVGTSH